MSVFIARSDCMQTRKRVSEKWNVWVLGIQMVIVQVGSELQKKEVVN